MLVADKPDYGFVWVHQSPLSPGMSASFWDKLGRSRIEGIESDSACQIEHWAKPEPSNDGPPLVLLDAGELRLTGGLKDLTLDFESGYRLDEQGAIFEPGDDLTLEVEGSDDVAPMSVTVTAPPAPVITPPPETLDIGEDLTVTWTSAPGKGRLQFAVGTYWDGVKNSASGETFHPREIVRCFADVSQGELTMPVSLLSQLSTDAPRPASFFALVDNEMVHKVGNSTVRFLAESIALTPSGDVYSFDAELKE
ncbi:hypothetical protein A7982_12547 [Minicystis rosea]|nr:hypothetical protein A7982_12547 [Minicystis rosea]